MRDLLKEAFEAGIAYEMYTESSRPDSTPEPDFEEWLAARLKEKGHG